MNCIDDSGSSIETTGLDAMKQGNVVPVEEGLALIKAFLAIAQASDRAEVIAFARRLAEKKR